MRALNGCCAKALVARIPLSHILQLLQQPGIPVSIPAVYLLFTGSWGIAGMTGGKKGLFIVLRITQSGQWALPPLQDKCRRGICGVTLLATNWGWRQISGAKPFRLLWRTGLPYCPEVIPRMDLSGLTMQVEAGSPAPIIWTSFLHGWIRSIKKIFLTII